MVAEPSRRGPGRRPGLRLRLDQRRRPASPVHGQVRRRPGRGGGEPAEPPQAGRERHGRPDQVLLAAARVPLGVGGLRSSGGGRGAVDSHAARRALPLLGRAASSRSRRRALRPAAASGRRRRARPTTRRDAAARARRRPGRSSWTRLCPTSGCWPPGRCDVAEGDAAASPAPPRRAMPPLPRQSDGKAPSSPDRVAAEGRWRDPRDGGEVRREPGHWHRFDERADPHEPRSIGVRTSAVARLRLRVPATARSASAGASRCPSITRKTDQGLPQYRDADESDDFVLSGAEDLVPVLVQDAQGEWVRERLPVRTVGGATYQVRRYRPRIEGLFARIEHWTNTDRRGPMTSGAPSPRTTSPPGTARPPRAALPTPRTHAMSSAG